MQKPQSHSRPHTQHFVISFPLGLYSLLTSVQLSVQNMYVTSTPFKAYRSIRGQVNNIALTVGVAYHLFFICNSKDARFPCVLQGDNKTKTAEVTLPFARGLLVSWGGYSRSMPISSLRRLRITVATSFASSSYPISRVSRKLSRCPCLSIASST